MKGGRRTATRVALVSALMLVRVMPEMPRGAALLVTAIGAGRRPGALERQHQHQKDEYEPSNHAKECNRSRVGAQSEGAKPQQRFVLQVNRPGF